MAAPSILYVMSYGEFRVTDGEGRRRQDMCRVRYLAQEQEEVSQPHLDHAREYSTQKMTPKGNWPEFKATSSIRVPHYIENYANHLQHET